MAANNAGRPAEAEGLLAAALQHLDGAKGLLTEADRLALVGNTQITLAMSEFLMGGLKAGLDRLAEAAEVVASLGDRNLEARLSYQRANLHGRVGDLAAAWEDLQRVGDLLTAFTMPEQAAVHLTTGMLAVELFKPQEALPAFQEAGRLAGQTGNGQLERMARHNEGYVTYLLGDIPRSLSLMAAADEVEADVSRETEWMDRARVLLEAGLVTEAIDALQLGDRSLPAGNDQIAAQLSLELSRGHRLLGHLDLAKDAAVEAGFAFARIGATGWEVKAVLTGLQIDLDRCYRSQWTVSTPSNGSLAETSTRTPDGRTVTAVTAGTDAAVAGAAAAKADDLADLASALGDHDLADQARVVAGEALLLSGDVEGARDRLLDPRRSAPGSLADELNAVAVRASMHVAANERLVARRLLSGAAKRLAAGQQGSASLDLRTARAVHGVRLAALDLDLAVPRGSGAVLEILERWRSATDRLPSLGRSSDERLAVLTEQLRSVPAQQRHEADGDLAGDLQRRAIRLEQQVRARDWALSSRSDTAGAVPVRVREARSALDRADRDFIWLFAHRGRLCGVGVVRGRAALRDLMPLAEASERARRVRVDLRAAATRQLGPLSTAVWTSLETDVARLDDAIVRPWRAHREGVVLVTCPEVRALPWSIFPSLVGRPLTVARSLSSFARYGEPQTVAGDGKQSFVHISVGPGLARARAEALAVAEVWRSAGAKVELNEPSRGSELVQALASGRIVHAAAHGTHQVQSPLFSSLSLHDGPVFAHELQPTGVAAEHVVLSACDVGSARFRPGDEQLGMAASMISLGAHSVVAAVAPIPDDVAAAAMTAHHEALARGAASDEALALAIASTDPVAAAFLNLGGRFLPDRHV